MAPASQTIGELPVSGYLFSADDGRGLLSVADDGDQLRLTIPRDQPMPITLTNAHVRALGDVLTEWADAHPT